MKDFAGRVAVVTGGASGIGLATAQRLAAEGMKLVLADVEPDALEAARSQLAASGAEVIAVPTDVSQAAAVAALAQATLDHFGAVHVVMNNAGVASTGSLWESRLEDIEWALGVNVWGVIHGIRSFVPILMAQGEPGHVVNTASIAALTTTPYLDVYTASKHAVLSLSECLYKELQMEGSAVGASVVCPGLIKTNLMGHERAQPEEAASEGAVRMSQLLSTGTEQGWDASIVADAIFEGIRDERFYIIPAQPEMLALVDQRLEGLRERLNPGVMPPG